MNGALLGGGGIALAAAVPWLAQSPYLLAVLTSAGIFIIAAISLNLLLGYTGQLSLGHAAFFGIGAYASALTTLGFDAGIGFGLRATLDPQPVWLGFLAALVVAGLFGWALGRLSFRVRGAYFVIVTVSFAQVVRMVALNWVELTQGPMALNNIPRWVSGGPARAGSSCTARTRPTGWCWPWACSPS